MIVLRAEYLFGFIPSIIWLLFYLRKDAHPESNQMIVKVFFLGFIAGFYAILLELGAKFAGGWKWLGFLSSGFTGLLVAAFIEEFIKYSVVRLRIVGDSEMDEGFDLILYMIISALGFAALENILNISDIPTTGGIIGLMAWRFVSATFLHALCSAVVGTALALSFYYLEKRLLILASGIITATVLHAIYNFSIMNISELARETADATAFLVYSLPYVVVVSFVFLLLFSFVSLAIKKIKRLKNVCLVN